MASGILAGMEDPERSTTYAAEDMVAEWLDAVCPDTGEVRVVLEDGPTRREVVYRPEVEPRFSRPEDVPGFVTAVLERLRQQAKQSGSCYRGRELRPVRVVSLRGWKKAKYRDGFIWLPERERGGAWALRGLVVLHELSHHLNTGVEGAIIDAHGAGFRATFVQLLEDLGWAQIATMLQDAYGQVGVQQQASGAPSGMLAKVGKLLRHAEGAANQAEREAFLDKAQALATAHSIELAVARAAHEEREAAQSPVFEPVQLGHRGQTSNARFVALMLAVADANDLRCSIRTDNTGVTLYGFAEDIQVTKALYVSLVVQMVADTDAYIRSGAHKPVHGRTARAAFYAGWTDRIAGRLMQARAAERRRAASRAKGAPGERAAAARSTELALRAKEVEIADYYQHQSRQHGVRGTWRGTGDVWDGHSVARGQAAAQRARLGKEKALPRG